MKLHPEQPSFSNKRSSEQGTVVHNERHFQTDMLTSSIEHKSTNVTVTAHPDPLSCGNPILQSLTASWQLFRAHFRTCRDELGLPVLEPAAVSNDADNGISKNNANSNRRNTAIRK